MCLSLEICTGRSDLTYDNLEECGVQVYGLPDGVPFHSPLLYNQQQLQQILANQDKIVFLKIPNSVSVTFNIIYANYVFISVYMYITPSACELPN